MHFHIFSLLEYLLKYENVDLQDILVSVHYKKLI